MKGNEPHNERNTMRYLRTPDTLSVAGEAGYHTEDGVLIDDTEVKVSDYVAATRYWPQTTDDRKVEEARWAARSGPVYVKRAAR